MHTYRHASIFPAIVLVAAAVLCVAARPSSAEVIVELSSERLTELDGFATAPIASGPGLVPTDKIGQPSDEAWFFPFVIDASKAGGAETLFSIRHGIDDDQLIQVDVEFFDPYFQRLSVVSVNLLPNQIQTFNARQIADFVEPGTVTRGFVRVLPDGPVEVDYFDVDSAGSFANGGLALIENELCAVWHARFMRFGADDSDGSALTFLINGPLGTDMDAPPTIRGEVFDENGNFSNSFTIHTDEWLLELLVLENLVASDGPQFGTIRIEVDSIQTPPAAVFTRHAAYGTYSVGGRAICRSSATSLR